MSNPPKHRRSGMLLSRNRNRPDARRRTIYARGKLYDLIAQFRREAASTDDPKARSIFEFAAEVVAGLARAFRDYEDTLEQPEETEHAQEQSENQHARH